MVTAKRVCVIFLISISFYMGTKVIAKPNPANAAPSISKFNSNVAKGTASPSGQAVVSQGDSSSVWAQVKGTDLSSSVSGSPAGNGTLLTANGSGGAIWTNPAGSSGAAGGDLTGTYPNPTIATGAVTGEKIANGSISVSNLSTAVDGRYVKSAGDTMTGLLTLNTDPTSNLHAATKQYVDAEKTRAQGAELTQTTNLNNETARATTVENGKVAKAGDTMTGALNLPTNGLTAGTSQLVLANGKVGVGTANPSNTLVVQKTVGTSDAPTSQHILQTEIQSGVDLVNPKSMAMGVLDNGQGMIQVKQVNVGYNDLVLNPILGNVCIGTQTAGATLTVNFRSGTSVSNAVTIQNGGANIARIDSTGKGFFNGGTQTGGADLAEAFEVEGDRASYSPGDVLMISRSSNRTVAKSDGAYSTLVAGVYATKPGVLLTEKGIDASLEAMVPMGVVGVIPTKVSSENGPIHRGDLLVSSSIVGHAMKGTDRERMLGAIIGKALADFDRKGTGVILVLVNVK